MKGIKLSQWGKNRAKYVALVDDEDFESINRFRWNVQKHGNTFYAIRNVVIDGKKTTVRMHCEILNGKGVDHIDHNGLNNQKSNLRLCTHGENMMNRIKQAGASSVYKGVCFYKPNCKWKAYIAIRRKRIHLGTFSSEAEAAIAYNTNAIELYGEFANLNIIV